VSNTDPTTWAATLASCQACLNQKSHPPNNLKYELDRMIQVAGGTDGRKASKMKSDLEKAGLWYSSRSTEKPRKRKVSWRHLRGESWERESPASATTRRRRRMELCRRRPHFLHQPKDRMVERMGIPDFSSEISRVIQDLRSTIH
jgi:hypothetical protein